MIRPSLGSGTLGTVGLVLVATTGWAVATLRAQVAPTASSNVPASQGKVAPMVLRVPSTGRRLPAALTAEQWLGGTERDLLVSVDYESSPARAVVEGGCVPGSILTVAAPGLISLPVDVARPEACGPLPDRALRLLPAAYLSGHLSAADRRKLSSAWVDVVLCKEDKPGIPIGRYPFKVAADRGWKVTVPAGCLDVSVQADSLAPVALARLSVQFGKTQDVGSVILQNGATVVIRVVSSDDSRPVPDATVRLVSEAHLAEAVPVWAGSSRGSISGGAVTSGTGLATLTGLAPGRYVVFVVAEGYAPAIGQVLTVQRETVTLNEVAEIGSFSGVRVLCPVAIDLLSQGVSLHATATPRICDKLFGSGSRKVKLSADGSADFADLPPGTWKVDLNQETEAGLETIATDEVHLRSREVRDVPFVLGTKLVSGKVKYRGQGLAADLVFARQGGLSAVRYVRADSSGTFVMVLDRPGVFDVDVRANYPALQTTVPDVKIPLDGAVLVITLPDLELEGSVVDMNGNGVPKALVLAQQTRPVTSKDSEPGWSALAASATTDASGRFLLEGVAGGTWEIRASKGQDASSTESVTLEKGHPITDVVLTLRSKTKLAGRVVSPLGLPVPNATLWVSLPPVTMGGTPFGQRTVTSNDGTFDLGIAPDQGPIANIEVGAPGFPLMAFRARVSGDLVLSLPAGGGAVRIIAPESGWNGIPLQNLAIMASDGAYFALTNALAVPGVLLDHRGGGALLLPLVPSGHWRLIYVEPSPGVVEALFTGWAGRSALAAFDVAPGSAAEVHLPAAWRSRDQSGAK